MRSAGRGRCVHRRLRRCRRRGDSSGRSRSRIRRTPRSGCTLGGQPFGGLPLRPETSRKVVISTRADAPRLCGIRRPGGRPGRIFHSTGTGRAHTGRRWRRFPAPIPPVSRSLEEGGTPLSTGVEASLSRFLSEAEIPSFSRQLPPFPEAVDLLLLPFVMSARFCPNHISSAGRTPSRCRPLARQ